MLSLLSPVVLAVSTVWVALSGRQMPKWKYTHGNKHLDSHYITFLPTESFNGAHGAF